MSETQETPAVFGFDRALQLLKAGQSVRRASWRADMRISLPSERAIMQSAPRRGATPWRWTLDHASILATDWQLAQPIQSEAAP
jgi:hypothetical protein